MFGSLEIKFPRLSGQSSSPHLMERHLPHFQPSSRRSLSCLPGWLKNSSSHLSHEGMSKFTFLFHTQRFFHIFIIQRSLTAVCDGDEGLLQAKPADREMASWVLQPFKFSHLFTIFDLQGAYPTSYLCAIFDLFWPGLNLLGKCFLCLSTF